MKRITLKVGSGMLTENNSIAKQRIDLTPVNSTSDYERIHPGDLAPNLEPVGMLEIQGKSSSARR